MKCYPTGASSVMLGRRISALRKKKGITQGGLADALDLSRSLVASWEVGQQWPTSRDIVWLSDYFTVSTDYLLKGIQPEHTGIHAATGLSDAAIRALSQFRQKDTAGANTEALSKALSSPTFLNCVTALMLIEDSQPGFFDGCVHTPGEAFYQVELSPDSYAALLSNRLTLIINEIRTGQKPLEYAPAKERVAATVEQLLQEGRIINAEETGQ